MDMGCEAIQRPKWDIDRQLEEFLTRSRQIKPSEAIAVQENSEGA